MVYVENNVSTYHYAYKFSLVGFFHFFDFCNMPGAVVVWISLESHLLPESCDSPLCQIVELLEDGSEVS